MIKPLNSKFRGIRRKRDLGFLKLLGRGSYTSASTLHLDQTAIFSQWMHRENIILNYASWKNGSTEGEVDMLQLDPKKLKPAWCVEIKWSNRYVEKPGTLKSLLQFCEKNKMSSALITTIDKHEDVRHKEIQLLFVPAAAYAYLVGMRTLQQKQS